MQSVRSMIGKPIISIESGEKLGTASDALLDESDVRLVGIVIGGGVLAGEHVLPFRDVQTVGADAVLARSRAGVVGAREWREGAVRTIRTSTLDGRPVVTVTGHRLGKVSDLLVEEQTGVFEALEVAAAHFGGLRTRHSIVRPGTGIRIGPDAVVVPDSAVHQIDEEETSHGDADEPVPPVE